MNSAAKSFGSYAESYEKSRPNYSAYVVSSLIGEFRLDSRSAVLELGAGTGKFTSCLIDGGLKPVATDWCPKMLKVLNEKHPNSRVIATDAGALPFAPKTFDVAVAAQAFHWFATKETLREIAGVLKPNGYLALVFQERVENSEWMKAFHEILYAYSRDARARFELGAWEKVFEDREFFDDLRHESFSYSLPLAKKDLVHRALSTSFLAALSDAERNSAIAKINDLSENHPELREKETIDFHYRTRVYRARALR